MHDIEEKDSDKGMIMMLMITAMMMNITLMKQMIMRSGEARPSRQWRTRFKVQKQKARKCTQLIFTCGKIRKTNPNVFHTASSKPVSLQDSASLRDDEGQDDHDEDDDENDEDEEHEDAEDEQGDDEEMRGMMSRKGMMMRIYVVY